MSRHSFDPEVAAKVGLNAAVIFQNIVWWAEKNAANNKHFHDGLWWTYNSVSAFADLFPYLTGKQIRTALTKLEDDGLLVSGSFNKSAYDRTKWYAPTCPIGKSDLPKRSNENAQKGEPIPDINTDIKPDVITPYSPPSKMGSIYIPDWMPLDAWYGWIDMRLKLKKPLTDRGYTRALSKLDKMRHAGQDIAEVLDRSTMNGWTDLYEIKDRQNAHISSSQNNSASNRKQADGFLSVLREVGNREDAFPTFDDDGGMRQASPTRLIAPR